MLVRLRNYLLEGLSLRSICSNRPDHHPRRTNRPETHRSETVKYLIKNKEFSLLFLAQKKLTLFNRLSTILHWCDISVTIVTILSLEPLARTNVGPKTIARFLASILLISLWSTIFFRCCIRYFSVSKWCSGRSRSSFRIVVIRLCGSSILSASMNMGYSSAVSKESGSWRKNDFSNDDITLTSLHLESCVRKIINYEQDLRKISSLDIIRTEYYLQINVLESSVDTICELGNRGRVSGHSVDPYDLEASRFDDARAHLDD